MVLIRPRIVFAGTASGVGKTTITMAFLAALRERGMHVRSAIQSRTRLS